MKKSLTMGLIFTIFWEILKIWCVLQQNLQKYVHFFRKIPKYGYLFFKWKNLPWTWVWVLSCWRHIPNQSKSEYYPPPPILVFKEIIATCFGTSQDQIPFLFLAQKIILIQRKDVLFSWIKNQNKTLFSTIFGCAMSITYTILYKTVGAFCNRNSVARSPKSMLSRIVNWEWIRGTFIPTLLDEGRREREDSCLEHGY